MINLGTIAIHCHGCFWLPPPAGWLLLVAAKYFWFQTGTITDCATKLLQFHCYGVMQVVIWLAVSDSWQCCQWKIVSFPNIFRSLDIYHLLQGKSICNAGATHWAVMLSCHDAATLLVLACWHCSLVVDLKPFFNIWTPSLTQSLSAWQELQSHCH